MTQPTTPEGWKMLITALDKLREETYLAAGLADNGQDRALLEANAEGVAAAIDIVRNLSASPSPPVGGGISAETCTSPSHARLEPVAQAALASQDDLPRLHKFLADEMAKAHERGNDFASHLAEALMHRHPLVPIEPLPPDAHGTEPSGPEAVMPKDSPCATSAAAQSWQPIETAPKDGTPILGFMPTYYRHKGGRSVVLWFDGAWLDSGAFKTRPTHWQPLPVPPANHSLTNGTL